MVVMGVGGVYGKRGTRGIRETCGGVVGVKRGGTD